MKGLVVTRKNNNLTSSIAIFAPLSKATEELVKKQLKNKEVGAGQVPTRKRLSLL